MVKASKKVKTVKLPLKSFFGRTGGKHFSKKDILPWIKNIEYDIYCK